VVQDQGWQEPLGRAARWATKLDGRGQPCTALQAHVARTLGSTPPLCPPPRGPRFGGAPRLSGGSRSQPGAVLLFWCGVLHGEREIQLLQAAEVAQLRLVFAVLPARDRGDGDVEVAGQCLLGEVAGRADRAD